MKFFQCFSTFKFIYVFISKRPHKTKVFCVLFSFRLCFISQVLTAVINQIKSHWSNKIFDIIKRVNYNKIVVEGYTKKTTANRWEKIQWKFLKIYFWDWKQKKKKRNLFLKYFSSHFSKCLNDLFNCGDGKQRRVRKSNNILTQKKWEIICVSHQLETMGYIIYWQQQAASQLPRLPLLLVFYNFLFLLTDFAVLLF